MKHDDYTVVWVCALAIEMAVAGAMLDERHDSLPQDRRDHNSYILGRIGRHNVAIACLPEGVIGITSAARVAEHISWTFRALRFGLMVGIGAGVPSTENDIRLGDVVVSKPTGSIGGVIQYDYGKTVANGRFAPMGSLNRPSNELLHAVSSLKARHLMEEPVFPRYLLTMGSRYPQLRATCTAPSSHNDLLFEADYNHVMGEATCVRCDMNRLVSRPPRADHIPVVHYGLVASGSQVMKDGRTRERLRKELNVLCFEMEAAGLMDSFPCLVIRGICDYADTHKNKQWQPYAAATAAAYAKELLNTISGYQVVDMRGLNEATRVAVGSREHRSGDAGIYPASNRPDSERHASQSDPTKPSGNMRALSSEGLDMRGLNEAIRWAAREHRSGGDAGIFSPFYRIGDLLYPASNRHDSGRHGPQSDPTKPSGNMRALSSEGLAQDDSHPMISRQDDRHAPVRTGSFHHPKASSPPEPPPTLSKPHKLDTTKIKGTSGDVEELDPRYFIRRDAGKFFERGRVFAFLWHEGAGDGGGADGNRACTELGSPTRVKKDRFGEVIYSYIRRMVVVQENHGFSLCLPINTYNDQGVTKVGLSREDKWAHSIVHMTDTKPFCLPEEQKDLVKKPIAVNKASIDQKLPPMSRINFREMYSVEHNVKVMNIGRVTSDCFPVLLGYWRQYLDDG